MEDAVREARISEDVKRFYWLDSNFKRLYDTTPLRSARALYVSEPIT